MGPEAVAIPTEKKERKTPTKTRARRNIDESALNANVADKFLKEEKE